MVILNKEELAVIRKIFAVDSINPQHIADAVREPTPEELEKYARLYTDTEGADSDFLNSWGCGFILGIALGAVVFVAIIILFFL